MGRKACNQADNVSDRHCEETEYVGYRSGTPYTMIGRCEEFFRSVNFVCKSVDFDFLFRKVVHAGVFLQGGQGHAVARQHKSYNYCVKHSAVGEKVAETGSDFVD